MAPTGQATAFKIKFNLSEFLYCSFLINLDEAPSVFNSQANYLTYKQNIIDVFR
jgi:hypothetical protein